ncbi:hypothetical protein ABT364_02545 [Massilia sp. SR12]
MTKLEADVVEVRERLIRIETRLEQTATREDVERMGSTLVKWMIGLMFGFTTMTIMVMTFVLNFAAPPQGRFAKPEPIVLAPPPQAAAQPPAIIINIPPGALQWQPAPEAPTNPRQP